MVLEQEATNHPFIILQLTDKAEKESFAVLAERFYRVSDQNAGAQVSPHRTEFGISKGFVNSNAEL